VNRFGLEYAEVRRHERIAAIARTRFRYRRVMEAAKPDMTQCHNPLVVELVATGWEAHSMAARRFVCKRKSEGRCVLLKETVELVYDERSCITLSDSSLTAIRK
jgi:hypothetical protein